VIVGTTAAMILAVAPAQASPFAFAATAFQLFRVDLGTGTAALIGAPGATLQSLAISPSGVLYGADPVGNFYTINTTTAAATLVGNTGRGSIEAMDFNGNTLTAVDFATTPTVFSINVATAGTTSIVTAAAATSFVRTGAIQNVTTMLIDGDSGLGCSGNCLFSLNLTTGALSLIGNMGGGDLVSGLDFAGSTLYGVNVGGEVFTVNPATGVRNVINDTNLAFLSLATDPTAVPEPATLVLLGTGLAAVLVRRRMRS
jgi:hypothetical protein